MGKQKFNGLAEFGAAVRLGLVETVKEEETNVPVDNLDHPNRRAALREKESEGFLRPMTELFPELFPKVIEETGNDSRYVDQDIVIIHPDCGVKRGCLNSTGPDGELCTEIFHTPRAFKTDEPVPDIAEESERYTRFLAKEEHYQNIYTYEEVLLATKAAHNAVQAINEVYGLPKLEQWDLTLTWYRASMTRHAEEILYHNYPCRKSHTKWVLRMERRGWTLGPEKSRELMTHPMLMDFKDLPEVEQLKLRVFRATVMASRKTTAIREARGQI